MNTRGILCATAAIMCLWAARPSAVLHSGVYVSEDSALVEGFVPAQVPETIRFLDPSKLWAVPGGL
jgi:hypothetical protein